MTANALAALRRCLVFAAIMATLTLHLGMTIGQGELGVVSAHLSLVDLPRRLVMAGFARLGRKALSMRVFVTAFACRKGDSFPLWWLAVAFVAASRLVFAAQWESREVVIKRFLVESIPIGGVGVAGFAFGTELAFVRIFVATTTRRARAEKLRLTQRRFFGVTVEAFGNRMLVLQCVARLVVIKLVHAALRPANELTLRSKMLNVTVFARLAFVLPAMQPSTGIDARAEILVALQTTRRGHTLA